MTDDDAPTTPGGPSSHDPTLRAPSASEGRRIGRYRLLDKLGEGGMGEVWRAEQTEPVRRIVALKLIKAGMDSRDVIARFEAERQALAMMDHPAIAKVLDAGTTPEGRPYFAMDYVAGIPITTYCDRRKLGTRERLELFQRVCEGVQHAHQKAVIHRDLKPSNVLVTDAGGTPAPKIIDFGVAKAMTQPLTDKTMHTELGQIIGTAEYMSPEQADLTGENVDTRTDVYSLGVILYQLLAGALPFDSKELRKAGYEGIRRVLREQEPPRPSTRISTLGDRTATVAAERSTSPKALRQGLTGDLDWIVMRALEKDRNRRYGSPQELAQDLKRHLANEPVEAGPPGAGYRAGKFVRRHRAGVLVTATLVLLLAAFAVTSLRQARSIARERDRAEAEAAKAGAMNKFLRDMLISADPWSGGGKDVTVASVLDAAVKNVDRSFANQPLLEAEMRAVLGSTYEGLGKLKESEEQTRRAMDLRLKLLGPDHLDVAESWSGMVTVALEHRDDAAATHAARENVRILHLHGGPPNKNLLDSLTRLAQCLIRSRQFDAAESTLTEAESALSHMSGDQRTFRADVDLERADIADGKDRNRARSDSLLTEALALYRSVDPNEHSIPMTLNNLATARMNQGKLDDAKSLYAEALAASERIYGTDHPEYATILENSANVAYQQERYADCTAVLQQVLDTRRRNLGPDNAQVLRTMQNMAALAASTGNAAHAVEIMNEVEPRLRAVNGTDHPDMVVFLRNKGLDLGKVSRFEEANAAFAESAAIATRVLGADSADLARTRVEWAVNLNEQKRWKESEKLLDAAFPVILKAYGEKNSKTQWAAKAFVAVYEATGRPEKAEPLRKYLAD